MSGRRKSLSGAGAPKKVDLRQSSFMLKAEPTFLDTTDRKDSPRKKSSRRSSVTPMSTQSAKRDLTVQKKVKEVYDMAATKKFESMLRGDLTDLPPLPRTMVKIFLSSTFSDMRAERNILAREVYPRLQTFCASRELDFQAVDMRWGVTEDSTNDHSVEKICLLEIENCQNTSVGPNFVVLSGDRYGYRPIPVNIDVETFEIIRYEANKLNLPNRELLDVWYKLDNNSVPATYTLQPIRFKFKYFGDFSTGCDELRKRDTTKWVNTFDKLQTVLRKSVDEAYNETKVTTERKHQFFQSVTESEIQEGILKATDVNSHCLVYKRRLRHLHGAGINDNETPRYIDVIKLETGNMLNEDIERLKLQLFDDKIKKKLDPVNIKEYIINWMSGGVNSDRNGEHQKYLESFCKDFTSDCERLIKAAEEENKRKSIKQSNYYTDYNSTIHHLRFCVSKCESFCGQEQVLEAAKSYILDRTRLKPLILYAQSGAGKTSTMAMIMKCIPLWLNNAQHFRLIRFIGTSPQCKNVYDLLVDVLGQLSDVYGKILSPHSCKTTKQIIQFAPIYLRQVAKHSNEPIIILLDSVDQLDSRNNAFLMEWLPLALPQNVKLIVSTLPDAHDVLSNLKKLLTKECFIEVPKLTEQTVKQIIQTYLHGHSRSLTDTQMKHFCSIFKQTPSPLYLKLLLDEAKKWNSYTPHGEVELVSSVKEAIIKLFQNISKRFGTLLVTRALGYLTVGLTGLTEFEIDDALSCDDDVLNEVYRFHNPPVPGIVQIPPLLWARIWYDIRGYLVERMSFGKKTLYWYHLEFVHVATDMFAKGDNEALLNKTLFEIYRQENGIKRTIILENRECLEIKDADRQVTPQPYKANKRKLACLPYHTIRAYKAIGIDNVKAEVYCNFQYLHAKISVFSVPAVVNDLRDFVDESKDEEVELLLKFITNCKQDLTNKIRFAFCLLAYVNPENNHCHLKDLLNEATDFLKSRKKQILIPEFPCLAQRHDASNAFQTSIQGISDIIDISNSTILLGKQTESDNSHGAETEESKGQPNIAVWSTEKQEMLDVMIQGHAKPVGQYILGNEYLYYITKHALVQYKLENSKSEITLFSDIFAEWKSNDCVPYLFANPDATAGVLVQDHSITLITLERLEILQTFTIPNGNLKIEYVVVLGSGQKLIAVGKTRRSPEENKQRELECNFYVLVLERGKDLPTQILEFDKHLDCTKAVLSYSEQLLLIPSKRTLTTPCKTQSPPTQPEPCGQLFVFEISEHFVMQKETEVSSEIIRISIHPETEKYIYLTRNGQVFNVIAKIPFELVLRFTVKTFTISWDDEIGLFCSIGTKLAMYDLKSDHVLVEFVAHSDRIKDICVFDQQFITLAEDSELKAWSLKTLLQDASINDNDGIDSTEIKETLLKHSNVVAIAPTYNGNELITSHDDHLIKVWSVESQTFIRQYNIGIVADIVHTFPNRVIAFHDTEDGKIKILTIATGQEIFQMPETVHKCLHSTTDRKDNLYIISSSRKGPEQIDIVSISRRLVLKTVHLQKGLSYNSIDAVLSSNKNYLVLRLQMSKRDFDIVKELYHEELRWKKYCFSDQHHRYRFTAVALSEGSGALIHCNEIVEKVPLIGVYVQPYKGNIMLVSTKSWIVFWDIPTGRCDRNKPSKLQKVPMFYRPYWIGREYMVTTRVFVQSADEKYIICGSDDGYVFVYSSQTGLPVCNRKPLSKHNAKVHSVVVSPNNKLVASSCQNSILKLWETSTGLEQFSVPLDCNVKGMTFMPDSRRLVLYTGSYTTRILLFSVTKKELLAEDRMRETVIEKPSYQSYKTF